MSCNRLIAYVRATTSVRANFLSILQGKTYFFYFTYSLLQNTHISLSILHIYSIKYSFFLHFLLFASLSSLELSHKHNTNPKSPTPSHRLLRWATNPTQTQNHPHPTTSHHQRSNRTNPSESLAFITSSFITASLAFITGVRSSCTNPLKERAVSLRELRGERNKY